MCFKSVLNSFFQACLKHNNLGYFLIFSALTIYWVVGAKSPFFFKFCRISYFLLSVYGYSSQRGPIGSVSAWQTGGRGFERGKKWSLKVLWWKISRCLVSISLFFISYQSLPQSNHSQSMNSNNKRELHKRTLNSFSIEDV